MTASRRKQRGSTSAEVDGDARPSPSVEKHLPPARPPRKNLPLLLILGGVFLAWVALLILLAIYS